MAKVRFLHISDLHFTALASRDPYPVNRVLEPLLNTVSERKKRGEGPDLIFVTGDLGSKGGEHDYDACEVFLSELLTRAGLSRDRLWVVPGNHDVDRGVAKFGRETLDNEADSQGFFGAPNHRQGYLGNLKYYAEFASRFFSGRPLAQGDVVHEPAIVEVKGLHIGILPLNSVWFSIKDGDQGKLWIGVRTVRERVKRLKEGKPPAQLIVALMHHPFHYFHEAEKAAGYVRKECSLVLCGHLHQPTAESVLSPAGEAILVTAGATYQSEDRPCRAFFGCLDTVRWTVRLDPVMYADEASARTWVIDPRVFPDKETEGCTREFDLPGKRRGDGPRVPPFPHKSWKAVNQAGWLDAIVEWFMQVYPLEPDAAMRKVLHHAFDIINNAQQMRLDIYHYVVQLGKSLRPCLPSSLPSDNHHAAVLELLELGIHRNVSHLFMLPLVDERDLLRIPSYSQLLLSTRYLASGRYAEAYALAEKLGAACCISGYVMGQAARKMELLEEAEGRLVAADRLLASFRKHGCPFSTGLAVICSENLLRAEIQRALGVVRRKLGRPREAEDHFERATQAATQALTAAVSTPAMVERKHAINASYDATPQRVVADVHFSHGYYWYEKGEYKKAEELFMSSIHALELAEEQWDSPYTRLAVIKYRTGEIGEAARLFIHARAICARTSAILNREAPLSLALCTLGLRAIELGPSGRPLTHDDPLVDLDLALKQEPPLGRGPLRCHFDDARNLLTGGKHAAVDDLVNRFTARLEQAMAAL